MKIPLHLGLIVDGNRRWAKQKNYPSFKGHKKGLETLEMIGDYALEKGVKILTVYIFSYENWQRKKTEVNSLMRLLFGALSKKEIEKKHKKGIRINIIGDRKKLSPKIIKRIQDAEELTKNNEKGILNLAISYSGRWDIVNAVKSIIKKGIDVEKITEEIINENLSTKGMLYPDLIIRTGGECRLSNFLIWQTAYSELCFIPKYWPSFTKKDLDNVFLNFSNRERRFGR